MWSARSMGKQTNHTCRRKPIATIAGHRWPRKGLGLRPRLPLHLRQTSNSCCNNNLNSLSNFWILSWLSKQNTNSLRPVYAQITCPCFSSKEIYILDSAVLTTKTRRFCMLTRFFVQWTRTQALATFGFGAIKNKPPAAKTQTEAPPQKAPAPPQKAPAPKQVGASTTQQRQIAQEANTAKQKKPPQVKKKTIVLKPAAARRSGISITRMVGGGRTIGNSAKKALSTGGNSAKKALDKSDLKNRIRVQSGSQPGLFKTCCRTTLLHRLAIQVSSLAIQLHTQCSLGLCSHIHTHTLIRTHTRAHAYVHAHDLCTNTDETVLCAFEPVPAASTKPVSRKLTVQPRRNDLSVLMKRKNTADTKPAGTWQTVTVGSGSTHVDVSLCVHAWMDARVSIYIHGFLCIHGWLTPSVCRRTQGPQASHRKQ